MSVITITPPPQPPKKPSSSGNRSVPLTVNDHIQNALNGVEGYSIVVRDNSLKSRLKGLAKSSVAWFNTLIASGSVAIYALNDSIKLFSPALKTEHFAIVAGVLATVTIILRARSAHKK